MEILYWTTGIGEGIVARALRQEDDPHERTILVADDDAGVRALIRTAVEERGYAVLEAASAAEIFRTLETQLPDVLLLDVHLGPDDGLALGAGLRQERRYSAMKIVFMSGTPDAREVRRLSRVWNVPILVKPFDFDALGAAIG